MTAKLVAAALIVVLYYLILFLGAPAFLLDAVVVCSKIRLGIAD